MLDPPSKRPNNAHLREFFNGSLDPKSAPFAKRLALFSAARAMVFSATAALVFSVLGRGSEEIAYGYSFRLTTSILLTAYASALLQWWASRNRVRMYGIALALLVLDQVLFTGIAFVSGGVASGATSMLGVTCLVGGLLLGVQGAVTAAFSGGVFFSLLVLATQGEGGFHPPDQPSQLYTFSGGQAAYYYVFNLLMLVLVGLLSSYLAERLLRTGGELEEARERADRAEHLAVLGQLAAGLAHEIRNPLGAISGSVQMLRQGTVHEEDRELCDIVLRESDRLNELVSDMLDLSRPREAHRRTTDLGIIVDEVVALASRSGRGVQDVEIRRLGKTSALVFADGDQIRQLVWNLVRNAVQASSAGGVVRVRLEIGNSIMLHVEDDGVGIDSIAREQLFDAFFSTRSKGTGLGLAVVKRIADEHGYGIKVKSEDGSGAQFIVDFGATEESMAKVVPAS